jgi:adenylate kinase
LKILQEVTKPNDYDESVNLADKLTLVVLGRSGSGKGTQAQNILRYLRKDGVHHMETGRFMRELLERDNATLAVLRRTMDEGGLMPAWFPVYTWLRELIEKGHADKHLVYDGAPRRLLEAEILDDVMVWHGRSLPFCVFIDVEEEESVRRLLLRSRSDDEEKVIRNRLAFFAVEVTKVIDYYKNKNRLLRVDGSQTPDNVWKQIGEGLRERMGDIWR